jgi:hypothetical protein
MLNIRRLSVVVSISLLSALLFASSQQIQVRSAEEIIRSYVEDFQADHAAAEPIAFGIRIKDETKAEWQVAVLGKKEEAGSYQVELRKGLPSNPSFIYTLDLTTLRKIDNGEINALTAMGRARMSDPTPMDVEFMPGFQPDPSFLARFLPFTFHFWTRAFPETVPFGKKHSREVHGANMVIFYYQKGLRSAWGQIDKGQHVNKDPKDQTNPFPTMVIGIWGKAVAKIGGKEVMLQAGQMAFIPAGVSHEAWNPYDEPAEIILLMFGEGA